MADRASGVVGMGEGRPHSRWPFGRRGANALSAALGLLALVSGATASAEQARPNGARVHTDGGLRYTHFTVTGVCSPSRAALLTGLNHHSAGVGHASDIPREFRGYRGEIHDDIPRVLGRPAISFRQFADDFAEELAMQVP